MDAPLEYVILGGLAAAGVLAGWLGARLSGRFRCGLAAAACSSVAAYLIWYPFVLGTYYVWWSGPTLQRFLVAEGDLSDFRRSGMTNFRVYFIRDNFGAGFYHLLLNVLLGLAFGGAAAALAIVVRRRGRMPSADAGLE